MTRQVAQRQRIALIDDDPDFQYLVRSWLFPSYDVSSLTDGEALLEELGEIDPDLVIMDVRMPGPDGFKLCSAIRADPRFGAVPILFLTACRTDEDFLKNIEAGGTAFRTKPIERKALLTAVGELLGVEAPRTRRRTR